MADHEAVGEIKDSRRHESRADGGTRCVLVPLAVTSVRREPQLRATRGFHNAMDRSITLAVFLAFGMPSLASAASIYRCTGPTGATVFSQVPCGKDSAEVGAGAKKAATPMAADPVADKAALADISGRCDAQSHKILDNYGSRFAEENASIADLHKRSIVSGADGAEKDPAVQKEIATVEARKTELLGAQDRELATLREQCQVERNAELKRQADREAARAVAKR
jgi:hypothetical protein